MNAAIYDMTTGDFVLAHEFRNDILIGRRAYRVLERIKFARTGFKDLLSTNRSDLRAAADALERGDMAFGLARPWPMLAARFRKIVSNDAAWVELDADGFRVDGASARGETVRS